MQQLQQTISDLSSQLDQMTSKRNQSDSQNQGLTTDLEQLEIDFQALKRKFKELSQENLELSDALKSEKNLTSSLRTEINELNLTIENNFTMHAEITRIKVHMQQ